MSAYSPLWPEDVRSLLTNGLVVLFILSTMAQIHGKLHLLLLASASTLCSVWFGMVFTNEPSTLALGVAPWGLNLGFTAGLWMGL